MIGATLIALFGEQLGCAVLHSVAPAAAELEEEDQYGFELNVGNEILYLQWEISKNEAARDAGNPLRGRSVLKTLGGT